VGTEVSQRALSAFLAISKGVDRTSESIARIDDATHEQSEAAWLVVKMIRELASQRGEAKAVLEEAEAFALQRN